MSPTGAPRAGPAASARRALVERAYTSREAAQISGVPFFTVDYWDRSKFLVPTVAEGRGRGKGRQRLYSYGDILRLRIARELRNQQVSLATLRVIVAKLAAAARELPEAAYVVVGEVAETARDTSSLARILRRSGRAPFGVLLDLRTLRTVVEKRAKEHVSSDGAARDS